MATLQASPERPAPERLAPERLAPELTPAEQEQLLELARFALRMAVRGQARLGLEAAEERLGGRPAGQRERGAAFVTLLEDGELRGCVGNVDPRRWLLESVALAAIEAATVDWRFGPVREAELPSIEVEVSVLGQLSRLDDPVAFELGVDGVVVERAGRHALLLPEVAPEHGLDQVGMLETACRKAGLRPDAWLEAGTTVFAFRTRRFGGPAIP